MSNYRTTEDAFLRGAFTGPMATTGDAAGAQPSASSAAPLRPHPPSSDSVKPGSTTGELGMTWRDRAEASLTKRRMTPQATTANIDKLQQKLQAVKKVVIPSFAGSPKMLSKAMPPTEPRPVRETFSLSSSGVPIQHATASSTAAADPEGDFSSTNKPSSRSPSPSRGGAPGGSSPGSGVPPPTTTHNFGLYFPNPKALAVSERVVLDSLPLEMFDTEELDRSPEEWVRLGQDAALASLSLDTNSSSAAGAGASTAAEHDVDTSASAATGSSGLLQGTPARALFFLNRVWSWQPCQVLSYDPATWDFCIRFNHNDKTKLVKRLSIMFDAEDEAAFLARVERAKRLREETRVLCRYRAFIEQQPTSLFASIQQATLHGILAKLMVSSRRLVLGNQTSTDALLREVRSDYTLASQLAVVEYCRRHDAQQEARVHELNLPALAPLPLVPHLAVIKTLKKAWQEVLLAAFPNRPRPTVTGVFRPPRPADVPASTLLQWLIERRHPALVAQLQSHAELWRALGQEGYEAEAALAHSVFDSLVDARVLVPVTPVAVQFGLNDVEAAAVAAAQAAGAEGATALAAGPVSAQPFNPASKYRVAAYPIKEIAAVIQKKHFSVHPECTQVILTLFKAWWSLRKFAFFEADPARVSFPITLYEYHDMQEMQFRTAKDAILNDWRGLCINLIRDNLSHVFALFVNDHSKYKTSGLKAFVTLLTFLLRDQLAALMTDSLEAYVTAFRKHQDPDLHDYVRRFVDLEKALADGSYHAAAAAAAASAAASASGAAASGKHLDGGSSSASLLGSNSDADADGNDGVENEEDEEDDDDDEDAEAAPPLDPVETILPASWRDYPVVEAQEWLGRAMMLPTPRRLLAGFLEGPHVSAACRPLFVFKLSSSATDVVFLPSLDSVESTICSIISASKLAVISQIQSEVTPLLGFTELPLCSESSAPDLFNTVAEAQSELSLNILANTIRPRALASLYQEYASKILPIDTDEFVKDWFSILNKREHQVLHLSAEERMRLEQERAEEEELARLDRERAKMSFWSSPAAGEGDANANNKKEDEDEEERPKHTLEETRAEIQKLMVMISEVQSLSPNEVTFALVKVEVKMLKDQLVAKAREVANRLLDGLVDQVKEQCAKLTASYEEMINRVKTKSLRVQDLAELKDRAASIEDTEIPALQRAIAVMQQTMDCLAQFRYHVPQSVFSTAWTTVSYPVLILAALEDAKIQIELDNRFFQKQLLDEQEKFVNDVEAASKEVAELKDLGMGPSAQMEASSARVDQLQERLDEAERLVQSFNTRDQLFGDQPQEYPELTQVREQFKPYYALWSTTALFNSSYTQWMTGSFIDLDAPQIEKDVNDWYKLMYRLEREFLSIDCLKPARVATEMKNKIAAFKEIVPIIHWLSPKTLRPRHWDELSTLLAPGKPPITVDHELTLSHILTLDVMQHKQEIEDLCMYATKEFQLETLLERMRREWRDMALKIEPYKRTGTYIVKGYEEILVLLDDQIMKTQGIRGSPYVKFFEARTKKWETRLQLTAQIMEEWLLCQKTWLYLEPIFNSDEIMRQMPIEARRFGVVDTYWRKTMETAFKTPLIMDLVSETDNLLKTFQESNKLLETISRGLNEYLETKRMAYPRFFFLSNDELLSILSQTKDATAIQAHLPKIFDAMHELVFTPEQQIITAMTSSDGEIVPLNEHVDPNEGAKRGNVEVWIAEVERLMKQTLQRNTRGAIGNYVTMKRNDWIQIGRAHV